MLQSLRILLCGCFMLLTTLTFSQTTAELFTTPGIIFGAYNIDDTHRETDWGYYYSDTITICDESAFLYRHIEYGLPFFAQILGQKVYSIRTNCDRTLLYDFSLEVGDEVTTGHYEGFVVEEKFQYQLSNGENRLALNLRNPDSFFNVTWVEGIGDLDQGLFPVDWFPFEWRRLACVKVDDDLILFNGDEEKCDHYTCIDPYLIFNIEESDLTISIENLSENAENYFWDFGDGTTSTEEQPVHEYTEGGCYTISLKVNNACYGEKIIEKQRQICLSDVWQEKQSPSSLGLYADLIPASDRLVFLHKGDELFYSVDQGDSWISSFIPLPESPSGLRISDIKMFDANRGILAGVIVNPGDDAEGMFYTEDGGASWQEGSSGKDCLHHCSVISNGEGWAVGPEDVFIYTQDFGKEWSDIPLAGTTTVIQTWSFTPGTLIGLIKQPYPNSGLHIGLSQDNGLSWLTHSFTYSASSLQFVSDKVAYASRPVGTGLFKTVDQGVTWEEVNSEVDPYRIYFHDENVGWIAGRNKKVLYTSDGGHSFSEGNCSSSSIVPIAPLTPTKALGIRFNDLMFFDLDAVTSCLDVDMDQDGYLEDEDCDDTNAAIHPDALEIPYNGWDDDCDELTLDDDLDEDGFLLTEDCDDTNAAIHPDALEIPYNGWDDDCNELTLDDDLDGDGFLLAEDCDDTNAAIHPDAIEIPYNAIDDDCNELTLDDDLDGDGFLLADDCDDTNANINPDMEDIPNNGIDENCDGFDAVVSTSDAFESLPQIFPNPTSAMLEIKMNTGNLININITNSQGLSILQRDFQRATLLDLSEFANGVYFLTLKSGKINWTQKIIKINN